ncbi:hypothetical protein SDJN03_07399, partial [Cucurbita argyrosperma subsp. sororia]
MGSSRFSSGFYPPEKWVEQPLQISKYSRSINKPPLPPSSAIPRQAIIKYKVKPKIIHVKTPAEFKYIVQLLTGSPNHPPPDSLDSPVLSPPPPQSPPRPDPVDDSVLNPPPCEEISIYDYDWEEPSYPIPIPPANFKNITSSYYPIQFSRPL